VVGEAHLPFLDQRKGDLTDQKILLALPEEDVDGNPIIATDQNGSLAAATAGEVSGSSGVVLHLQLQWEPLYAAEETVAMIASCKEAATFDTKNSALGGMSAMKKVTDLLNPFATSGKAQRFIDTIGHPFHYAPNAVWYIVEWRSAKLSSLLACLWWLLCWYPQSAPVLLVLGLVAILLLKQRSLFRRQQRRQARAKRRAARIAAEEEARRNAGRRRARVKREVAAGVALCSVPVVKVHSARGRYERVFKVTDSGFCTIDPNRAPSSSSSSQPSSSSASGAAAAAVEEAVTNAWSFADDFISVAEGARPNISAAESEETQGGVYDLFDLMSTQSQVASNAATKSFRAATIEIRLWPREQVGKARSQRLSALYEVHSRTAAANGKSRVLRLETANEFQATRIMTALRNGRIGHAPKSNVMSKEYAWRAMHTSQRALGPKDKTDKKRLVWGKRGFEAKELAAVEAAAQVMQDSVVEVPVEDEAAEWCSEFRPVIYCNVAGGSLTIWQEPTFDLEVNEAMAGYVVRPNATIGVVERVERTTKSGCAFHWLRLSRGRGWVADKDEETDGELLIPQTVLIAREHRRHVVALRRGGKKATRKQRVDGGDERYARGAEGVLRAHLKQAKLPGKLSGLNKNKNVAKVASNLGVKSIKGVLKKASSSSLAKKGRSASSPAKKVRPSPHSILSAPQDIGEKLDACTASGETAGGEHNDGFDDGGSIDDDESESDSDYSRNGEGGTDANGEAAGEKESEKGYVAFSNRGVEFGTRVENVELLMQILELYADVVDRLVAIWETSLDQARVRMWLGIFASIILPVVIALCVLLPPKWLWVAAGEALIFHRCRVVTSTVHYIARSASKLYRVTAHWVVPTPMRNVIATSVRHVATRLGLDDLFTRDDLFQSVLISSYVKNSTAVDSDDADDRDQLGKLQHRHTRDGSGSGGSFDASTIADILGELESTGYIGPSDENRAHVEVVVETQRWFGKWRADVWLPFDNDHAKPPKGWRFDGLWRASSWQYASTLAQGSGGLVAAYLSTSYAASTADKIAAVGLHKIVVESGAAAEAAAATARAKPPTAAERRNSRRMEQRRRRGQQRIAIWRDVYVVGDSLRRRVWQRRIVPDTKECKKAATQNLFRHLRRRLVDVRSDGEAAAAAVEREEGEAVAHIRRPQPRSSAWEQTTTPQTMSKFQRPDLHLDVLSPSTSDSISEKHSDPRHDDEGSSSSSSSNSSKSKGTRGRRVLTPRMSTPAVRMRLSAMKTSKYDEALMERMIATCPTTVLAVYENQRWWPGRGWTCEMLPTDGWAWSDESGKIERRKGEAAFNRRLLAELGADWEWAEPEWRVEHPVDPTGSSSRKFSGGVWAYTTNFSPSLAAVREWIPKRVPDKFDLIRRRKWVRTLVMVEAYDDGSGDHHHHGGSLDGVDVGGGANAASFSLSHSRATKRHTGGVGEKDAEALRALIVDAERALSTMSMDAYDPYSVKRAISARQHFVDPRLDVAVKTLLEHRARGVLSNGALCLSGMHSVKLKITALLKGRASGWTASDYDHFSLRSGVAQNVYIVLKRAPSEHDGLHLPGAPVKHAVVLLSPRRSSTGVDSSSSSGVQVLRSSRSRSSSGNHRSSSPTEDLTDLMRAKYGDKYMGGDPAGTSDATDEEGEGATSGAGGWFARLFRKRKVVTTPWDRLSLEGVAAAKVAETKALRAAMDAALEAMDDAVEAAHAAELADADAMRMLWTSEIIEEPESGGRAQWKGVLLPLQRVCGDLTKGGGMEVAESDADRIGGFDIDQPLLLSCYSKSVYGLSHHPNGCLFLGQARVSLRYLLSHAPVVLSIGPSALGVYGRDASTTSTVPMTTAPDYASVVVELCELSPRRVAAEDAAMKVIEQTSAMFGGGGGSGDRSGGAISSSKVAAAAVSVRSARGAIVALPSADQALVHHIELSGDDGADDSLDAHERRLLMRSGGGGGRGRSEEKAESKTAVAERERAVQLRLDAICNPTDRQRAAATRAVRRAEKLAAWRKRREEKREVNRARKAAATEQRAMAKQERNRALIESHVMQAALSSVGASRHVVSTMNVASVAISMSAIAIGGAPVVGEDEEYEVGWEEAAQRTRERVQEEHARAHHVRGGSKDDHVAVLGGAASGGGGASVSVVDERTQLLKQFLARKREQGSPGRGEV